MSSESGLRAGRDFIVQGWDGQAGGQALAPGLAEVSRTVTIRRMDALFIDILSWLVFPGGCIVLVALLVG